MQVAVEETVFAQESGSGLQAPCFGGCWVLTAAGFGRGPASQRLKGGRAASDDAARENADVFPTRGFQRLRSWAGGSAWGHIVVPPRSVPRRPRGSLELGFARTPGPRAPRVLCKRLRIPASHLCREPFLVKENLLRAIVWLPLKHVYDGELSPSSAQPAPFLDSCGG